MAGSAGPSGGGDGPGGRVVSTAGPPVASRGTLVIDVDACKGCNLCIEACPPRVLEMTNHDVNERGYCYPQLRPGCTGCGACAQICPDFVFQVYRYESPAESLP